MKVDGLMAVNFTGSRATSTMNRFVSELIEAMKQRGECTCSTASMISLIGTDRHE